MQPRKRLASALFFTLAGCAATAPEKSHAPPEPLPSAEALAQEVRETEAQFAASMAKRDFNAFSTFLSDEAIFFSGKGVLHGKHEVAEFWRRFYEKPEAPFSWEPEKVEVLESGTLALSSGPVRDPSGKLVATFTSIWRREGQGKWRIIFDKGNDVCP